MDRRQEKGAADHSAANYSLIADAYIRDVIPETTLGTDARYSLSGTLGESLLYRAPTNVPSRVDTLSGTTTTNQYLADQIAVRCFDAQSTGAKRWAPYQKPNEQLNGMHCADIEKHEKQRWASIFECLKLGVGVYAGHRWAPQFLPPRPAPSALIGSKFPTGVDHIFYAGPSQAELLKEMKARYTATCIGGMAAGWAVSHVADQILFPHDQYMEATLAGDVGGIGLAIVVPSLRAKAALVVGTHLLGKTIDHWRQPQHLRK